MKYINFFFNLVMLGVVLFPLFSCAKPTVVNTVMPEDKNLSCIQLETALEDAQDFRERALAVTGNTAKNNLRAILFWPALMMTYANAHEAILAATERSVHVVNLMQKKKCKNTERYLNDVKLTLRVQTLKDLTEAYKSLNELYKSGGLSEKEYRTQKKKVLGQ
jgi:hypothetical protein